METDARPEHDPADEPTPSQPARWASEKLLTDEDLALLYGPRGLLIGSPVKAQATSEDAPAG